MNPDHLETYFLETFFRYYETDSDVSISYGDSSTANIVIFYENLSFFNGSESIPKEFVWDSWKNKNIPFLFNREEKEDIISIKEDCVHINYDIIAPTFYFLSHWQEIHQSETDKYGRFPYQKSIQYRHDFVTLPVVNYYFDILFEAIEKCGFQIKKKDTFDNFQVFLSHDIDNIYSGWLEDSFAEFKKGNVFNTISILKNKINGKDTWDNLGDILKLEQKLNVVSTFFFLTRKGKGNADYQIKQVEKWFKLILDSGSEVGLHGSLNSAFDLKKLSQDIQSIDHDITGNRFHFLKFDANISPEIIDESGLQYDSSMGFAEQVGFRSAFCFPYHPYNLNSNKPYSHLQIPLMIMDTTIRNKNYMGTQSEENIMGQINQVVDEVEKFGGVLSILWHNSYFSNFKFTGWLERFIHLVQLLKDKSAHFYTGKHITDLYSDN